MAKIEAGTIKAEFTQREFYLIKEALQIANGSYDTVQDDRDASELFNELKNYG